MFFPASSAVKHEQNYKEIYARLVSKSGIKMKRLVAVQRKLLELIYIIFKNKTVYQSDYIKEKRAQLHEVEVAL